MTAEHIDTRTLTERVHVPAHPPRTATPAYRAIHRQMVEVEDLPCLVCGVRHSTLGDPGQNPAGAKAMETHHRVVEWSLAGAVDLAKFNLRVVARERAKGKPGYERDLTQEELEAWVDHSRDNLWVLCDVHHRHPRTGIHAITYPIWTAQDLLRADWDLTPDPDA